MRVVDSVTGVGWVILWVGWFAASAGEARRVLAGWAAAALLAAGHHFQTPC